MSTHDNEAGRPGVRFSLLGAAIAAGFAAPAEAAFISTATGVPVSFTLSGSGKSVPLDINGDAVPDFTVTSTQGSNISIAAGTNRVSSLFGDASAFANTAGFKDPNKPVSSGGLKTSTGVVPIVTLSGGTASEDIGSSPGDIELVFKASGQSFVGYLAETLTVSGPPGSNDATFTITDFGYDPTPLPTPEPSSLALLASGAAGLTLLRRRRAARAA